MRASIILAHASLMSNMTEAVKVTTAVSDILTMSDDVHLWDNDDCSGPRLMTVYKLFIICDTERWCAEPFTSAYIPAGKDLEVFYVDNATEDSRILTIVGDGTCVNVLDRV